MMQELKQKVSGMDFGHKLTAILNVLALLVYLGLFITAIVGKNWNPFELGRSFERHCLVDSIANARRDAAIERNVVKLREHDDSLAAHSRTIAEFGIKFSYNAADHTRYENKLMTLVR
jgi:hypothetical protein